VRLLTIRVFRIAVTWFLVVDSLSDSTITRNAVGISTGNSGQLISYRTNRINNNIGPDGAPTSFLSLD